MALDTRFDYSLKPLPTGNQSAQMGHCVFDAAQGEIFHVEDFADFVECPGAVGVLPFFFGDGVQPGRVAEAVGDGAQAVDGWQPVFVIEGDGAVRVVQFFWRHTGVSHDKDAGVFGVTQQFIKRHWV